MIRRNQAAVTIPVMAKARIGHIVEARILEALGVDFIDEIRSSDARRRSSITSTNTTSKCRSCAVAAIWAKRCGASAKARR